MQPRMRAVHLCSNMLRYRPPCWPTLSQTQNSAPMLARRHDFFSKRKHCCGRRCLACPPANGSTVPGGGLFQAATLLFEREPPALCGGYFQIGARWCRRTRRCTLPRGACIEQLKHLSAELPARGAALACLCCTCICARRHKQRPCSWHSWPLQGLQGCCSLQSRMASWRQARLY